MPSTLGADLQNYSERYGVDFDETTKTWRIVDLRNPELSKIPNFDLNQMDTDIPDDNPAVTIINELMFVKLIQEAIKIGQLAPSVEGVGGTKELKDALKERDTIIKDQEDELDALREEQHTVNEGSESFKLKSKIVDVLGVVVNENSNDALKSKVVDTLRGIAIGDGVNETK